MEIKNIEDLKKGDRVVVQHTLEKVRVHKVKEIYPDDGLIVSEESDPLDVDTGFENIPVLNEYI